MATETARKTAGITKKMSEYAEKLSLDDKVEIQTAIDLEQDPTLDPEWRRKEKKLVRKLDMTLMPMVWILYLFNYLDRNNIA